MPAGALSAFILGSLLFAAVSWATPDLNRISESSFQVNSGVEDTRIEASLGYREVRMLPSISSTSTGESSSLSASGPVFDLGLSRLITERLGFSVQGRFARLSISPETGEAQTSIDGLATAAFNLSYGVPFEFATLVLSFNGQVRGTQGVSVMDTVMGQEHLALRAHFESYFGKIATYQGASLRVTEPLVSPRVVYHLFAGLEAPLYPRFRAGLAVELSGQQMPFARDLSSAVARARYDIDGQTQIVGRVASTRGQLSTGAAGATDSSELETGISLVREIR
jgi:hypothetical protein